MVFLGPVDVTGFLYVYVLEVSEKQQRLSCEPQKHCFYSMMLNICFMSWGRIGGYARIYENMRAV